MEQQHLFSEFLEHCTIIRKNIGKKKLTDDELLFIAAEEIGRSFTRDEIDKTKGKA